jgi:anti-anti-sigma factor
VTTTDSDTTPPILECRLELADGAARLVPIGEIDIETAPIVHEHLEDVRSAGIGHVVLDLRAITFIDSTGMHLAHTWQDRAGRERFTFELIPGPAPVQRAFDAAGLGAVLNFVGVAP